MFLSTKQIIWLLLPTIQAGTVTYTVPTAAPTSAATLDPAPVGISFEFFTFPSYFTNVTATNQCLKNFQSLTGTWPHIRIGGTTQDRATYDASTTAYVVYTVPSATAAPTSLTFGSSFFTLAASYAGSVIVGLNRGKNDIANTIAAAKVAVAKMTNLRAIELGNEPEYYLGASQPVATQYGSWTPAIDAANQNDWDIRVGSAIGRTSIIQAGNSFLAPPKWGAAELIATENATVKSYVYDYAHHNYPGGNLTALMSHSGIVSNLKQYTAEVAAAATTGKDYVLGETNSVAGGGASTVSPLFGAGLWTMDYILNVASRNIKRMYFHHGTIARCYYCWWGRYDMASPYYGAYAATAAMAGGTYISALDPGTTAYGVYIIYDSAKNPLRAVLYNSDYYGGSGTRGSEVFTLHGLTVSSIQAKRLTAPNSNSRVDQGSNPTFGGQTFENGTCIVRGTSVVETTSVSGGAASFTVLASEALVLYLQ